jgi:PPM family protein phosphatase
MTIMLKACKHNVALGVKAAEMSDETVPMELESPQLAVATLSRRGGRSNNEDFCGHRLSPRHLCCVVADGAGGHGGGDIASKLVVEHILDQAAFAPLARGDEVQDLLMDANVHLRRHQSASDRSKDMHTTAVALFVDLNDRRALWGHAGDSRLYLFREGQVLFRTHDHSFVQSMVDAGLLMPEQVRSHPKRSQLLSALGSLPEDLLLTTGERWPLKPNDVFLLCTDGLWEYVAEAEMIASLGRSADPQAWLAKLEELVLLHAAEAGKTGHDNFSGIAVWVGEL